MFPLRPWRFTTGNHLAIYFGSFDQGAAQRSQSQDGAEETQGRSNCYSLSCTLLKVRSSFIYSFIHGHGYSTFFQRPSVQQTFWNVPFSEVLEWMVLRPARDRAAEALPLLLLLSLQTCSLVTVHCLACCFNALSGRLLQDRALLQAFCLIDVILCGLPQEETEWFCQVCIIQPMGIFGMRLLARNVANDTILRFQDRTVYAAFRFATSLVLAPYHWNGRRFRSFREWRHGTCHHLWLPPDESNQQKSMDDRYRFFHCLAEGMQPLPVPGAWVHLCYQKCNERIKIDRWTSKKSECTENDLIHQCPQVASLASPGGFAFRRLSTGTEPLMGSSLVSEMGRHCWKETYDINMPSMGSRLSHRISSSLTSPAWHPKPLDYRLCLDMPGFQINPTKSNVRLTLLSLSWFALYCVESNLMLQ